MPSIDFGTSDAINRLTEERDRALQAVEGEYARLVDQLRQVSVARQDVQDTALVRAANVCVTTLRVWEPLNGFELSNGGPVRSQWCQLLRPLKPGQYRAIVFFMEDEAKTETAR